MELLPLPPRLIIEGVNYAGKDTILNELLDRFCKNAITIRASGYWRKVLVERVGLSQDEICKYIRGRCYAHLPLISEVTYEEFLLMRLHLTDIVYAVIYANQTQNYHGLEDELNNQQVALVLLDVDDATLERRRTASPRGASGHADRSLEMLKRKRDLFRDAFDRSTMTLKLLVNNSDYQPAPELQAQHIITWWNNLGLTLAPPLRMVEETTAAETTTVEIDSVAGTT